MKGRCRNEKHPSWARYGGRGITVCERWLRSFDNFLLDMGERPIGYSLDRIDNDKDYSPENCRWATRKQQQNNKSDTRKAVIEGREYLVTEIAQKYGFKADTLITRAQSVSNFDEWVDKKRRVYTSGLALGGRANGIKKQALTHCKNGHEFTENNTYVTKEGWRACRACHVLREHSRQEKLRLSKTKTA